MSQPTRNRYSDELKAEALKLAERTSVASAAREPGIHESQIYGWRSAAKKKANVSERESELAAENARLKRLGGRYHRLTAIGKVKQQVTTAVAREMADFLWAIVCEVMDKPHGSRATA